MAHVEVPGSLIVLGHLGVIGWDSVVVGAPVITTSFEEECLVAGEGEACGQGATAGAGTDDDVLISRQVAAGADNGEDGDHGEPALEVHFERVTEVRQALPRSRRRVGGLQGSTHVYTLSRDEASGEKGLLIVIGVH